jgi:hypothetical protein
VRTDRSLQLSCNLNKCGMVSSVRPRTEEPSTLSTKKWISQKYAKSEPQLTFLRNRSDLVQGKQENNSQRIVDESEAAALFSEGWRFVTTLRSGRLVVERDPRLLLPPQT